jgi:hypothetical protein
MDCPPFTLIMCERELFFISESRDFVKIAFKSKIDPPEILKRLRNGTQISACR